MSLTYQERETQYNEAIQLDQKVFDEMKSNILLYAGNHFTNRNSKYFKNMRGASKLQDEARIKLVKNHLHKICNKYINNIVSHSPGVTIVGKNAIEMRDRKDAELCLGVWNDIKYKHKFGKITRELVEDFVILGELWIFVTYDHNKGNLIGYAPAELEDGSIVPDHTKPVYDGAFKFEVIPAYDVFRDPGALTLEESRWFGIRKMVDQKEIESLIDADISFTKEQKLERKLLLEASRQQDQYNVFNGSTAQIIENTGKRLIKQYIHKPCVEYPDGQIFIDVAGGNLWELDLPKDIFGAPLYPLIGETLDRYRGSPRGFSKIRQMRPGQAEINRTTSKIAETQITLGDDKVYTTIGGGITEGAKLPGVREVKVKAGLKPEVVQGRSGEQFFKYMEYQTNDLYRQMDVTDDSQEKEIAPDITSTLYRSLKEKKKYTIYSSKFERVLVDIAELVIKTAKAEYRDDKLIRAVGRSEALNIAEFKRTDDANYTFRVEPMSEDIDSMMGKYLQTKDLIQYTGSQLTPEQIGRIASQGMSFIKEEAYGDLIRKDKSIETILLQMDRGENPLITPFDDNEKIIEAVTERMQQDDFKYLVKIKPEVEEIYLYQYEERQKVLNKKLEELKAANAGIIPTGGVKVKVDAYITDPNSPTGKPMRATVDQVSLQWFLKRLSEQGAAMEDMQELPIQAQVDRLRVVNGG